MEENGRQVSFIFRGTEVVTEETKEDRIRYIRTNELLASDAESARTYYHYASDEIGNITHVVNDTHVLNHYEYDVWGKLTVCEETVENRFKYNGQQFDPISQQYYLRARYYNPVIGRFTQEDTYRGDGLNLYAYCRNNPIVYIDPSGNICETAANRIREKVANNSATKNEQRKLAAYDRNEARKRGEAPSEYYTDSNGSWHRPNGEYAKNIEVGLSKTYNEKHNSGTIHNPYGKKGGPEHQSVIQNIKKEAQNRGLQYREEYRFNTDGGIKNTRYADVVIFDSNNRVMEIHQVGKTDKSTGAPVSREREAIRDIRMSKNNSDKSGNGDTYKGAKIIFHPYDRK